MPSRKYYRRHRGHSPKLRSVCDLKSPEDRFWEKVNKTEGCWEWQGSIDNLGYGRFNEQRNSFTTHRASYEFTYGRIVGGFWVLHKCDNRKCVRPDHLFLGTPIENVKDMVSKKRHFTGPRPWQAKLTVEQVKDIRGLCAAGMQGKVAAQKFGVSSAIVYDILKKRTWRHVD